jgi:hypothetical protein
MKRLFGETATGYPGSILSEDIFNELVGMVMGTEDSTMFSTGEAMIFTDGTVITTDEYDANGDFLAFRIEVRYVADHIPYEPSDDFLTYRSGKVDRILIGTDYVLLRPDGTVIDAALYTLNEDGSVVFTTARTEPYLTMNEMNYIVGNTVRITRDPTSREIVSITI